MFVSLKTTEFQMLRIMRKRNWGEGYLIILLNIISALQLMSQDMPQLED